MLSEDLCVASTCHLSTTNQCYCLTVQLQGTDCLESSAIKAHGYTMMRASEQYHMRPLQGLSLCTIIGEALQVAGQKLSEKAELEITLQAFTDAVTRKQQVLGRLR